MASDFLAHEVKYSPLKKSKKYKTTGSIVGRRNASSRTTTTNDDGKTVPRYKYGNYASPYYDPVARHERYMKERSSLGIGKGTSSLSSGKSSGKGSGKGKGGKGSGSGKGGKGSGSGKGSLANLSEEVKKLREESSLNTEAQREATQRKIADLKDEIKRHLESLGAKSEDQLEGVNAAEIKGKIQSIRAKIEEEGGDLQKWISTEKDALERRIAALYSAHGKEYKVRTQEDKQNSSTARDTEVKSRADSIYKRKS